MITETKISINLACLLPAETHVWVAMTTALLVQVKPYQLTVPCSLVMRAHVLSNDRYDWLAGSHVTRFQLITDLVCTT